MDSIEKFVETVKNYCEQQQYKFKFCENIIFVKVKLSQLPEEFVLGEEKPFKDLKKICEDFSTTMKTYVDYLVSDESWEAMEPSEYECYVINFERYLPDCSHD